MTTGRINQVTTVRSPDEPVQTARPPGQAKRPRAAQYGRSSELFLEGTGTIERSRPARPRTASTPHEGVTVPIRVIQLPPLSSSKDGPPQKARSEGQALIPETVTCAPQKEDTPGPDHIDRGGRRLPGEAYPQKSGEEF
jgi:hypothetical protein